MRREGMATLAAREERDGLRMKRALPLALVAGRRKRLTLAARVSSQSAVDVAGTARLSRRCKDCKSCHRPQQEISMRPRTTPLLRLSLAGSQPLPPGIRPEHFRPARKRRSGYRQCLFRSLGNSGIGISPHIKTVCSWLTSSTIISRLSLLMLKTRFSGESFVNEAP